MLDSCAAGMMKLLASMDLSHSSTLKLWRLKKASESTKKTHWQQHLSCSDASLSLYHEGDLRGCAVGCEGALHLHKDSQQNAGGHVPSNMTAELDGGNLDEIESLL